MRWLLLVGFHAQRSPASASRSTSRSRKGRLKGADKGRCCGKEREEKKRTCRGQPTTTTTRRRRTGEVIGKRVREVRFNTRTSSSFYTRWFYIRPLSCYQPSAVWVHSYLRRHRDPDAFVLVWHVYTRMFIAFARRF